MRIQFLAQPVKVTQYRMGSVYENEVLQFTFHEEGSLRVVPTTGSVPAYVSFDYFLKDHLGNVRMVLTSEKVFGGKWNYVDDTALAVYCKPLEWQISPPELGETKEVIKIRVLAKSTSLLFEKKRNINVK
jgi:hypothetical protein